MSYAIWSQASFWSSAVRSSSFWTASGTADAYWVPNVMLCRNPYVNAGGAAYGCGQCMPCRINRRRMWQHRIMLEAMMFKENCFATLTYSADTLPLISLPTGLEVGSLVPRDLQLWLKRLREEMQPLRLRFYGVGEYGDVSFRPHYHVVLFGFPGCFRGRTKTIPVGARRIVDPDNCCPSCKTVSKTWGKGLIECGGVNAMSAAYIARYTIKKMTKHDDPRLEGRYPEFARMSLRPGIGATAMANVAQILATYGLDERMGDVPLGLDHGRKTFPLARYLRRKLRGEIGRNEKVPEEILQALELKMRPLREVARASTENPSYKKWLVNESAQEYSNFMARHEMRKRRDVL